VDNLIAGAPASAISDQLIAWGVPQEVATSEVRRFADPAVLDFLRRERQRSTWESQVVALRRAHLETTSAEIVEADWPSPALFYREFYAQNRPVIFRNVVHQWGAGGWTMEYLSDRFGDVMVSACMNRESSKTPDRDFNEHQVTIALRAFIARIADTKSSNDLYLIANNHVLRDTALRALLNDVRLDDGIFDPGRLVGSCSLWIGPAGTITPLHHDISNILFGQVEGRKRVTLVPPHYVDQFEWDNYYAYPAHPPFEHVPSVQADLTPGDALLIPAGWLHHVEALEPSVNFSLLCFRRPNAFQWFRPGAAQT